MLAITKPVLLFFRFGVPRRSTTKGEIGRRKQTTIDLIHASPHLRQDIGLTEEHVPLRRP